MPINKILNLAFSKKNKFLSFLYNDLTMQVFNLTKVNENKSQICKCKEIEQQSGISMFVSTIKVN